MIRFNNCMTDITVTLQDYEMAEVLGIENGDREMRVAYDTIDWSEIDEILGEIALALVAKNGAKVRQALSTEDDTEVPEDGDAPEDEPDPERVRQILDSISSGISRPLDAIDEQTYEHHYVKWVRREGQLPSDGEDE